MLKPSARAERSVSYERLKYPLGGFIEEVESGAGLQTPDAATLRYEKLCNEAQLDIDKEVPPPPVAIYIYIGDFPACTFGNFISSIGKPKGKNTFNVSAMTAAAMTNSPILNYRGNMPANQKGILNFDTEQSNYHAFRVFKRIAPLTRKSNHEINERIKYFALRKYSVEDRIGMIDHKIRNTPAVGLVIIDGIRDLMTRHQQSARSDRENPLTRNIWRVLNRQNRMRKTTHGQGCNALTMSGLCVER